MPIVKVRVSGAAVAQDVDIVRGTAPLPPTPMWRSSPWVGNHFSIFLIRQLNPLTDLFTVYSTPLLYKLWRFTIFSLHEVVVIIQLPNLLCQLPPKVTRGRGACNMWLRVDSCYTDITACNSTNNVQVIWT